MYGAPSYQAQPPYAGAAHPTGQPYSSFGAPDPLALPPGMVPQGPQLTPPGQFGAASFRNGPRYANTAHVHVISGPGLDTALSANEHPYTRSEMSAQPCAYTNSTTGFNISRLAQHHNGAVGPCTQLHWWVSPLVTARGICWAGVRFQPNRAHGMRADPATGCSLSHQSALHTESGAKAGNTSGLSQLGGV